ncbi:MAG TPA: GNAT family N-acetyltransferase [Candidatus Limnocylindrales bacterium]
MKQSIDVSVADRATVNDLRDQLAHVYRIAFEEFGEPPEAAEHFRTGQLPKHVEREGFRFALARETGDAGRVVGFAYGYTGDFGQWWTDRVARLAPAEIAERWLGGHFEFVELAVDPAVRGRGIGTALHDLLLEDLPHRVALLTTYRDRDLAAPRLYRRKGWRVLVSPLDPNNDLYGLDLPNLPNLPPAGTQPRS